MNTNTSTEGNGKKALKVTQTNDANKLINKYFEEFINEYRNKPKTAIKERNATEDIEYFLSTHSIIFKASEQSTKTQGGDENENGQSFASSIDVLESGKRDFIPEEIANGVGLNMKRADLRKVKTKADKIRREDADKKREESNTKETDEMEK